MRYKDVGSSQRTRPFKSRVSGDSNSRLLRAASPVVRAATDRDFRQDVKARLAERSDLPFDSRQAVAEHVRFFREAMGG
jgi:hypothetical protein